MAYNLGQIKLRDLPLQLSHPGVVYWVSNVSTAATIPDNVRTGNDTTGKGTFNSPFATVDYAIGRCVANRGDVIMVMPGHSENLTAAAAITSDIAGVAIVGLGTGSVRPKFIWTVTTADWDVTAANCSFVNLQFESAILNVVSAIDVSAVAGISFEGCHFKDQSSILTFIDVIDVATGASDFYVNDCKFIGLGVTNDAFITGLTMQGFYVSNSYFNCNAAQTSVVPLLKFGSSAVTNALIKDCHFGSAKDGAQFFHTSHATNSGIVANCYFSSIDTAGAVTAGFDFTGGHFFECYVAGDANGWAIVGGGAVYNNA